MLTLEILADIYLSNIDNWRDPSILAVNSRIAALIPDKPIIVIVPTVCCSSPVYKRPIGQSSRPDMCAFLDQIYSVMTLVGSSAMAKAVPEFNTAVRLSVARPHTTLVDPNWKVDRWDQEVC